MRVLHFEKGLHYNDQELLVLARKIGKLATYCARLKSEDSFIRVEAEKRDTKKDRDSVKVTVEVSLPGKILMAESRRNDVIEALDRALEKIEPQLMRYKDMKVNRGQRRDSGKAKRRIRDEEV